MDFYIYLKVMARRKITRKPTRKTTRKRTRKITKRKTRQTYSIPNNSRIYFGPDNPEQLTREELRQAMDRMQSQINRLMLAKYMVDQRIEGAMVFNSYNPMANEGIRHDMRVSANLQRHIDAISARLAQLQNEYGF